MRDPAMAGQHDEDTRFVGNGALSFVNPTIPNVARIYDYMLGGKDNFPADRQAAAEIINQIPDALSACHHNRRFLQRAVRFLASEAGIRQFIDIGTGLPTQGNVHEIAQSITPDARVVYVDYDPVVVSHAQAIMATNPTVVAINRDLRRPDEILNHPALQALINLDEPVAILLVAVLHFISDDDGPYEIVARLKDAVSSGSYLVVSHITGEQVSPEASREAEAVYERSTQRVSPRSRKEIKEFFNGLEIIEPGVVNICTWGSEWRPPESIRTLIYAGMARK